MLIRENRKLCPKCGEYKDLWRFHKDKHKSGGVASWCKSCDREKHRLRMADPAQREKSRNRVKKTQKLIREIVSLEKSSGCSLCGYNKTPTAIEFHYINQQDKENTISQIKTFATLSAEIDKCIMVCANCHRELHAGLLPRVWHEVDLGVWGCM